MSTPKTRKGEYIVKGRLTQTDRQTDREKLVVDRSHWSRRGSKSLFVSVLGRVLAKTCVVVRGLALHTS